MSEVRLVLLGTGGPWADPERQGSAVAVQAEERLLVVDAGRGAALQLVKAGFELGAVDRIFVTHHHFDHIGALGDLLLSIWVTGRSEPVPISGPPGTGKIVSALLNDVYAADIAFRHAEVAAIGRHFLADVAKLLPAHDIGPGLVWEDGDARVYAEIVQHGAVLDVPGWTCLGYRLEAGGKVLAISGDTVPCEGLSRLARGANVLVQCCPLLRSEESDPAVRFCTEHILAGSGQVGRIAAEAGVERLVLTHFRPLSQERLAEIEADVRESFDGELVLGHDLLALTI